MNDGEMALVLGAVVLLALLVLNINRAILGSTDIKIQTEAIVATNSVGQQMIDLIATKSFDENTVSADVETVEGFTAPNALGSDAGEVAANFDDVDDYKNYTVVQSTPRLGNCNISVDVNYVNQNVPDQISAAKTRMKRIQVNVTSVYLPDTLKLYYYYSY